MARFDDHLAEKKNVILDRWFNEIIESYPSDTAKFLKNQKNRFANPVGSAIYKGIEDILNGLLRGDATADMCQFLDNIVRIRAVQDFTPSQAISFIFLLKKIIREVLGAEICNNGSSADIALLDLRIDDLGLSAFDIYMKCREKVYEIKTNEARRLMFRLLQRANLVCETDEKEPEPEVINLNIKRGEKK